MYRSFFEAIARDTQVQVYTCRCTHTQQQRIECGCTARLWGVAHTVGEGRGGEH